jgi:hypothetical protein
MKGQVILKNLQWLGRHNPAFPPGSVQTAVAELLNPTSSILPYSGHLCLGEPRVVCTGTKYFNIDAGATKNVNFQILMPTAEGTYPVYLDVFSNDQLLIAYQADENIVVTAVECVPETTKCEGYDLYSCTAEGKWVLVTRNSLQCGYVPPEKPPVPGGVIKCNQTFCLGGWYYACWPDGYGYPQFKANWCIKDTPPIK